MPIRASLHFHSTLLKSAEIKHFPDLFCRYLSENSENRNFQNHFCHVHNLFIFYSIAETYETVSATLYSFKKVSNCCLLYYSFLFRERTFCQISIIHSYPVSRFLLTSIPISTSRQSIPAWFFGLCHSTTSRYRYIRRHISTRFDSMENRRWIAFFRPAEIATAAIFRCNLFILVT